MYISTREGLGQTLGQQGLGQCVQTPVGGMTFVDILATIECELQRKFADSNDPKLFARRRRLRELFRGVPSPKAKDLFDQLQQMTDPLAQLFRRQIATPTRKELLSILFFAEYDLRSAADIGKRIKQVRDAVGQSLAPPPDHLVARRDTRAKLALDLPPRVPGANPASAALRPITVELSTGQLNLFREFFPDGSGGINFDDFRLAFEQFANGELRDPDPAKAGKREPNGGLFFLFAEFAFLCVDSKINDADWRTLLKVFVQTQEIVIHIYRPAPHRVPPDVGKPPKCRVDAQGKRFPPRPLDGPGGFEDKNFNAVGQSNAARKAALRAKYARMDEWELRWAAQENLLRAQCMP